MNFLSRLLANPRLLDFFGVNATDIQGVSSLSLQFRNADELGSLVFALMLMGLFVWWSYYWQPGHRALHPAKKTILTALRIVLLAMLLALLLRPVLALEIEQHIRRTLLILVDATKSMNIRDQRVDEADQKRAEIGIGAISSLDEPLDSSRASEAKTVARTDLVKAVFQNPKLRLLDTLAKDSDIETYFFGQNIAAAPGANWLSSYHPTSNTTAIGDAVRTLLERKRGQPVAGIFLITDGGNNAGSPPTEAAEDAGREGVPIFAYGVGITSPRDIIVSHLTAQDVAFVKDQISVTVQVRGQGMSGETGRLALKLGDDEVASTQVTFTGADQVVTLSFTPNEKGDYELTAGIPPRDDETSKENNYVHQRLRVIDEKIKVLYVEQSPRYEFRFLQQVLLRDRRIQASFVLLDGDPGISQAGGSPYLAKFPDDPQELFKYDMILIGDVDPNTFSAAQLANLDQFVSKLGGACMFLAGRNYMPAAYRGTVVEKMLPVELQPFSEESSPGRAIRLTVTSLGQSNPMLRLAPDEEANNDLWSRFPPVYWDARVARPKPAAQVLIVDIDPSLSTREGGMPIFATQQYGVGQVYYLGTEELWRIRRNQGADVYPLLWGQIVQGGAMAHLLGISKKTQLSVDKEEHNVGDTVTVFARLYTDSFQPVTDEQVKGQYTIQPSGTGAAETDDLLLRSVPDQPGMYRGDFVALKEGRYRFATANDPAVTVDFTVREPQFELGETAMNEALLKEMAASSGGEFFREEDLSGLPNALNAKPVGLRTTRDVELWSSPAVFTALFLVAVAEWILRKAWQLK